MLGRFFKKATLDPHTGLNLPSVDKDEHTEIANLQPKTELEAEQILPPARKPLLSIKNIPLIVILLLLLSGTLGIWSWSRYNHLSQLQQAETKQHELELDSLLRVKEGLGAILDQLELKFTDLSTENDTLAHWLAEGTNIIADKEAAILEMKRVNVREEKPLREQVQRLQTIKDRYEAIIQVLDQKNVAWMEENERLRGMNGALQMEISELGRELKAQISKTFSAQFKATGFRLEMNGRNGKPTIRASRTRELKVFFELNHIPASYRGNQFLYMVITDDKGKPINSPSAIAATVKTLKGEVSIVAQTTQLQNVIENQQIEMSYKLADRLKKGTYVITVYSEKGPLGVASFSLT